MKSGMDDPQCQSLVDAWIDIGHDLSLDLLAIGGILALVIATWKRWR